ncbi:LPS assembly protein LptD [Solimonas sp. C16B3]|uniref:LPS-assembly protein LptD n=1 Tax=Solimonas marina TaxID=2714601 RepID=A0A969W6R6_9GAMM|nr:LPS assembly protein LptD [Solimonas marina]
MAAPAIAQSTLSTENDYSKDRHTYSGSSCAQLSDTLPPLEPLSDDKVHLSADNADLVRNGLSTLTGSVRVRRGDQEITANRIDYDEAQQRFIINDESVFRSSRAVIDSQHAQFSLNDDSGLFSDNSFTLLTRDARGHSDELKVNGDKTAELTGAAYTTCAPGNDSWYLEASHIHLDYDAGVGTATNARLRFQGVPIFYSPWLQFPINDQRRSGLLYPVLANTNKTGFDLREPLYLNLAPNYDATFTPRYMSKRGTQLELAGRYLLSNSEGNLGYQYLDQDRVTDERRTFAFFNDRSLLSPNLSMELHYADVSDPRYFEDLGSGGSGNGIDLSTDSFLDRSARLTYNSPGAYSLQVLVQDYQKITSSLTDVEDPYRRLPQVLFNTQTRNSFMYTRAGMSAEYSNFVRDDSVQGQRYDVDPYLKIERDTISWYSKAQLDYRYTGYELTDTAAGDPNAPHRALPIFSAEYGLRFERMLADGTPQTLEPRLFYLYVPYRNQSDLPVFDSGDPDFDFTQLFSRNRFSGLDRISDANEVALGLTGRQLDPSTGAVKASASIGQLYRFEAPKVSLPGEDAPNSGATDFIGEFAYNVSKNWGTHFVVQWSPEQSEFSRTGMAIRYRDDYSHYFEAAYRYRRDLLEEADLTAMTPIYHAISLASRWRYSVKDSQTLDSYVGLRYDTCCYAVDVAYRHYISDSQGNMNNGIYFQLELKGLGQIGSGFPNLRVDDDVY